MSSKGDLNAEVAYLTLSSNPASLRSLRPCSLPSSKYGPGGSCESSCTSQGHPIAIPQSSARTTRAPQLGLALTPAHVICTRRQLHNVRVIVIVVPPSSSSLLLRPRVPEVRHPKLRHRNMKPLVVGTILRFHPWCLLDDML